MFEATLQCLKSFCKNLKENYMKSEAGGDPPKHLRWRALQQ